MKDQIKKWIISYLVTPVSEHEARKPKPLDVCIPVEAPKKLFAKTGGRVLFTQMSIDDLKKMVVWLGEVIAWKESETTAIPREGEKS